MHMVHQQLKVFNNKIFVSSTKSSIGHLLGAAGSVESIFSIMSMNNNILPATLNLDNPIETNNINLIPKEPIEKKISYALSNSFGFGGTNTALLFKNIYNFSNYFFYINFLLFF